MTTSDGHVLTSRPRVAVLISGRGSNLQSLLDVGPEALHADIVGVLSSRRSAKGLERARAARVPAVAIERGHDAASLSDQDEIALDAQLAESTSGDESAQEWEVRLLAQLAHWRVDWIVLAGWMRILSDPFVAQYEGRMVNIHPSLLPAFPGLHPQRQALEHGVKISGCTVHHVVPGDVDSGPIIAQAAVPVEAGDTVATLSDRILAAEHELYPKALGMIFGR